MRIIIAGGRDFSDYKLLKSKVTQIISSLQYSSQSKDYEIVSGHAKGADSLGEIFAKEFDYKLKIFPANWSLHGKSAGHIRNKEMAEYAKADEDYSVLIAFWNSKSKGTQNMIELASRMLDKVIVVNY